MHPETNHTDYLSETELLGSYICSTQNFTVPEVDNLDPILTLDIHFLTANLLSNEIALS